MLKKITSFLPPPEVIYILLGIIVVAFILGYNYERIGEYWRGIAVEAAGVAAELFVILVLIGMYEKIRNKTEKISRLEERISDFKRIEHPIATGIILSSVRELCSLGRTNIEFSGARLKDISFFNEDISSLRGSVFSIGIDFKKPSRMFTKLDSVNFSGVDCSNVVFGSGNIGSPEYRNCDFQGSDLRDASFVGAILEWDRSNVVPDRESWFEEVHFDEEEQMSIRGQVYSPAFEEADLRGANFSGAHLKRADFRGANNILDANFKDAVGLDSCFFDEGIRTQIDAAMT